MSERPQDRWDKKNGYVRKAFGMYQKLADDFKAACEKDHVPQSRKIAELMQAYIDEVNQR